MLETTRIRRTRCTLLGFLLGSSTMLTFRCELEAYVSHQLRQCPERTAQCGQGVPSPVR